METNIEITRYETGRVKQRNVCNVWIIALRQFHKQFVKFFIIRLTRIQLNFCYVPRRFECFNCLKI